LLATVMANSFFIHSSVAPPCCLGGLLPIFLSHQPYREHASLV
jgi:hypothetical protein